MLQLPKTKNLKKYITIISLLILVPIFTSTLGFNLKQATSLTIIVLLITTTFLFWNRRLSYGFTGIALLLAFGVLDIHHFIEFSSFDIIIFLIGMMVLVGYVETNHLFEFLIDKLIRRIGRNGKLLVAILLVLSAFLAALVDEVTSILIMTSIIIQLMQKYKVNPVPFVLMSVFATNIGSSATVVGNPVGVMIAFKGGLSFMDFLRWATPISMIALFAAIILLFIFFRKDINEFDRNIKGSAKESSRISSNNILKPAIVFFVTVVGLIFHSNIEHALHLEKNTMLIGMALLGAGIAMLLARDDAAELLERRVDWWTLVFFMFLFASVGSLEYTGVIDIISGFLQRMIGTNLMLALVVILLFAGLLSAILDNVVAVAIMIPIIENLVSSSGYPGNPFWWVLLFAATLFGNLTFIGSTANIVALGILGKRKLGQIGFWQWFAPGFIVTVVTAGIAFLLIVLQIGLMR